MGTINPDTPLHDPDYDIAVRDPEAAARGLAIIQQLLDEGEEAQERKDLRVGEEVRTLLRDTLSGLHPADTFLKRSHWMSVSSSGTACARAETVRSLSR